MGTNAKPERDKTLAIEIAGEHTYVPARAQVDMEREREGREEEIEFEIKWTNP
jgi:hypothetical protein